MNKIKSKNLGLVKKGNKIYSLVGFFNHFETKELNCSMIGSLPKSTLAMVYQREGFLYAAPPEIYVQNPTINFAYDENVKKQIKHFGLDPKDFIYSSYGYGVVFLFKIFKSQISIFEDINKCEKAAIKEYLLENDFLPKIVSDNYLAQAFADPENEYLKSSKFKIIDLESFNKITSTLKNKNKILNFNNKKTKSSNDKVELLNDFELLSDYEEYGLNIGLDLFELREQIIEQAKRKGGFVDFEYNNKTYKIPKIPLLAWALNDSQYKNKYTIHNHTWYPISPCDLKTDSDNPYHSDWWLGAGFPIETYSLYKNSINYDKFLKFNKDLSNFAFELIGKDKLNDVTYLSGNKSEKVSGKLIKYPQDINSFDEDDIILLKSGGIEFDSYIKKACKNGKGGVILEVGNKVSHLTIVSKEYNAKGHCFRLILLPNADKLLNDHTNIELNPLENSINPID